jgi:hypothetical protein
LQDGDLAQADFPVLTRANVQRRLSSCESRVLRSEVDRAIQPSGPKCENHERGVRDFSVAS